MFKFNNKNYVLLLNRWVLYFSISLEVEQFKILLTYCCGLTEMCISRAFNFWI